MTVRRTLLALATATLMSAPAWVLPGQALSHANGPPSATPNNATGPGAKHRSANANDAIQDAAEKGKHGQSSNGVKNGQPVGSHKCKPHEVAYVATGTLEPGWKLMKNSDGSYKGMLTVKVTHTNHHAAGDKGKTKTYTETEVENVHVTFVIADTDKDGVVESDDLIVGDRVKLIGEITTLAKKCNHTGFEPKITVNQIVFHEPPKAH
jgi:hypothetical protein